MRQSLAPNVHLPRCHLVWMPDVPWMKHLQNAQSASSLTLTSPGTNMELGSLELWAHPSERKEVACVCFLSKDGCSGPDLVEIFWLSRRWSHSLPAAAPEELSPVPRPREEMQLRASACGLQALKCDSDCGNGRKVLLSIASDLTLVAWLRELHQAALKHPHISFPHPLGCGPHRPSPNSLCVHVVYTYLLSYSSIKRSRALNTPTGLVLKLLL